MKLERKKKGYGESSTIIMGAPIESEAPIVTIMIMAPLFWSEGRTRPTKTKIQVYTPPTPRMAIASVK